MGNDPAFASVTEAMDMARAALGYLAATDAAALPTVTQAECLRRLEQTDAISTAVRASFLSAFSARQGYADDADYSARAWLMHKTSVTDCALFCFFHHQVVIHQWGWTVVLNPDGTTTAWNKDKTKVVHSHGPPARPG